MGRHSQSTLTGIAGACLALGFCVCVAGMGAPVTAPAASGNAEQARADYLRWLDQYSRTSQKGYLIITAVEGDERQLDPADRLNSSLTTYGCVVSETGAVARFLNNGMGSKGSSRACWRDCRMTASAFRRRAAG